MPVPRGGGPSAPPLIACSIVTAGPAPSACLSDVHSGERNRSAPRPSPLPVSLGQVLADALEAPRRRPVAPPPPRSSTNGAHRPAEPGSSSSYSVYYALVRANRLRPRRFGIPSSTSTTSSSITTTPATHVLRRSAAAVAPRAAHPPPWLPPVYIVAALLSGGDEFRYPDRNRPSPTDATKSNRPLSQPIVVRLLLQSFRPSPQIRSRCRWSTH